MMAPNSADHPSAAADGSRDVWTRILGPVAMWVLVGIYAVIMATMAGDGLEPKYGWNGHHHAVPGLPGRIHVALGSGLVAAAAICFALAGAAMRARGGEERLRSLVVLQGVVLGWIAIDMRFQRHEQLPGWWGPLALALTGAIQGWLLVQMRPVLRRIPATWVPLVFAALAGGLVTVDAVEALAHSSVPAGLEHLAEAAFAFGLICFAWAFLRREIDGLPPGADRLAASAGWIDLSGATERRETPVGIRVLWLAIGVVVAAGALVALVPALTGHATILGLIPTFDLDGEWNVPAFFSTMLIVAAATLAFAHAACARAVFSLWRSRWLLLAAGLAFMAVDETASLHEMLGERLHAALGLGGTILEFSWVVVAVPVVALGALFFWPMVKAMPAGDRRAFVVAGVVYFGGAVGVEMPEGWVAANVGSASLAYESLVVLEEAMEIVGMGLVVSRLHRMLPFARTSGVSRLASLGLVRRRAIPRCVASAPGT